jgi:hypothetical protein
MEQPSVIRFFMLKRLKAGVIHTELVPGDGPETFAVPIVKMCRTYFHQRRTDLFDDPISGKFLTNDVAEAIGSMVEERSFSSCEVLCHHFRIERATRWRILHSKPGLKRFHLRWVLHALSIGHKSETVSSSKLLLTVLREQKASGFQQIITGMSRGSSLIVPVIRSGRRRVMNFFMH